MNTSQARRIQAAKPTGTAQQATQRPPATPAARSGPRWQRLLIWIGTVVTAVVVGGAGIAVGASLVRATSNSATNVVVDFENGIGAWFVAWSKNDLTLAQSVMPASPGHH